jgi:hypothetical protein
MDSSDFIKKTMNMHLDKQDIMVHFDVVSLLTKISILESLDLISKLVDPKTLNLIEICLTSTFLTFKGIHYEQTKGTTIGSFLSLVVATVFIEQFETLALNTWHIKRKCSFRFFDYTFVVWSHGHPSLISFFDHINSIFPHIQFTMEIQKDNSLPFLEFSSLVFLMAPHPPSL